MSILWLVLSLVALQRLVELYYARRNTRRLLAQGGLEVGAAQYPFFILLHAAWLCAMLVAVAPQTPPRWWLLGLFVVLQLARIWVVRSLGPYWTTRIITVPNAPLVRRGPYRFVRHPNYLVVVAEIAVLPLAFNAIWIAVVFSVLNALLLSWRIRLEESALSTRTPALPDAGRTS